MVLAINNQTLPLFRVCQLFTHQDMIPVNLASFLQARGSERSSTGRSPTYIFPKCTLLPNRLLSYILVRWSYCQLMPAQHASSAAESIWARGSILSAGRDSVLLGPGEADGSVSDGVLATEDPELFR